MHPLVFEPYLRPMIWGGRKLAELFARRLPGGGPFGESWDLSPHPHHVSRVAEGAHAGRTLTDLCREEPAALFGATPPADARFPLLVKLLDCRDRVSLQVHPNDALAARLAGERFGKAEAWVILDTYPDAVVYAGLQSGVTRAEVEHRLSAGTLIEAMHRFTPTPGDCLFLPAGTVHAAGGVVLAEVQQASDATFRLHDWDRLGPDGKPRPLHVTEALQAIDWSIGPVHPVVPARTAERLVTCREFLLDRITPVAECPAPPGRLSVWLVLAGAADLRTADGYRRRFARGDTVLIPAAAETPRWHPGADDPPVSLLCVTIPESA
ncbi:MAG: type I phosphomannose isomerase catalytic subunit [Gemmataceae bacterium]